jgi:hypothetical protein
MFLYRLLFLNSQMVETRTRKRGVKLGVGITRTGDAAGAVIRDGAGGGIVPLGK